MGDTKVAIGILLLALLVIFLAFKYERTVKRARLPWWGWLGLATILAAEALLFLRTPWVTTFFTPLVWTGYLLFVDGLVRSVAGESRLGSSPRQFLRLVFWSVPLWLIFEAYNLRLANWTYVGLPEDLLIRSIGYLWSFATIWPAIFETADFLKALDPLREQRNRPVTLSGSGRRSMFVAGLLCVSVPVLVPVRVGQYLFGAVWVGFVLLLDPLNYRWKGRSLLGDVEAGHTATFYSLLGSGFLCGLLWEFWNYWADAKWLYIFPVWQDWKVFEMPLPGYLGFPVFALECFVMYEFLGTLKSQLLRSSRSQKLDPVRSGP